MKALLVPSYTLLRTPWEFTCKADVLRLPNDPEMESTDKTGVFFKESNELSKFRLSLVVTVVGSTFPKVIPRPAFRLIDPL